MRILAAYRHHLQSFITLHLWKLWVAYLRDAFPLFVWGTCKRAIGFLLMNFIIENISWVYEYTTWWRWDDGRLLWEARRVKEREEGKWWMCVKYYWIIRWNSNSILITLTIVWTTWYDQSLTTHLFGRIISCKIKHIICFPFKVVISLMILKETSQKLKW